MVFVLVLPLQKQQISYTCQFCILLVWKFARVSLGYPLYMGDSVNCLDTSLLIATGFVH